MVDNGILDKAEFEMSVRRLLITEKLFLPIFNERLSSGETLQVFWERFKEKALTSAQNQS